MFVQNFKILVGTVVPEKSLTKQVYTHTEKAKTIYPLYTLYTGGIIIATGITLLLILNVPFVCCHGMNS